MQLSSSVCINDDDTILSKKKPSTMRKTIKRLPDTGTGGDSYYNNTPSSIADVQAGNEVRNARVTELMTQMASLNQNNDGNSLADFKPLSNPELTVSRLDKEPNLISISDEDGDSGSAVGISNLHGPVSPPPPPDLFTRRGGSTDFSSNNADLANLSSYNKSYEHPKPQGSYRPYYANMGIGGGGEYGGGGVGGATNSKVMEKINYMIHMMEEQQYERTNNVMEEFLLYSFLGIFVIFVVDSFSRIGKYTR